MISYFYHLCFSKAAQIANKAPSLPLKLRLWLIVADVEHGMLSREVKKTALLADIKQ